MSDITAKDNKLSDRETQICLRVGYRRRFWKFTQQELGEILGITRSQVTNIESGRTPLKFGLGWKFCHRLNVNELWLATGEGNETPTLQGFFINPLPSLSPHTLFSDACLGPLKEHLREANAHILRLIESSEQRAAASAKIIADTAAFVIPAIPDDKKEAFVKDTIEVMAKWANPFLEQIVDKSLVLQRAFKALQSEVMTNPEKMPALIARLSRATQERGAKSALARFLGVPLQRVREWLAGEKSPGGETTLRLLEWVTAEEAKQKTLAGATNAHKSESTRSKESKSNEKLKSSQRKE